MRKFLLAFIVVCATIPVVGGVQNTTGKPGGVKDTVNIPPDKVAGDEIVSPTPTKTDYSVCIGDIDGNGVINTMDLTCLVQLLVDNKTVIIDSPFGDIIKYHIPSTHHGYLPAADIDSNGFVETLDLTLLVTLLQNNVRIFKTPFGEIHRYEINCPR